MVELFGKEYYIDVDAMTERCRIKDEKDLYEDDAEVDEEYTSENITIDVFKYDILKMCIERVLSETEELDNKMDVYGIDNLTPSFKLAFNTLIKNTILIDDNE